MRSKNSLRILFYLRVGIFSKSDSHLPYPPPTFTVLQILHKGPSFP